MTIITLILALNRFVGLVVIHESGHFFAARKGGVEVEEFGLGFPPKAWGKKLSSGLLFTINWLPLGGFVRLKGEHDSARSKGSFGAASLSVKVKIMLAGVAVNLTAAYFLMTFLALVGMPKIIDDQFTVKNDTKIIRNDIFIGAVEEGSPAQRANMLERDRIISIESNGAKTWVANASELPQITKMAAGKEVSIAVVRAGKELSLKTTLRTEEEVLDSKSTNKPVGYLGVSPAEYTLLRSTWSAPVVAAGVIKQLTTQTFVGLGKAVWNIARGHGKQASEQVAGPVSIFILLKDSSAIGPQLTIMIIAIISLTLAIMNILPIPALDGGRLFVTLLYHKILKKPLSQEMEEKIHCTVFLVLLALMAVITLVDIRRL